MVYPVTVWAADQALRVAVAGSAAWQLAQASAVRSLRFELVWHSPQAMPACLVPVAMGKSYGWLAGAPPAPSAWQ